MQKLDDIVLKKGDIVSYCKDTYDRKFEMILILNGDIYIDRFQELNGCKIIKVQRPIKYETIYETPKPILEKKEKEYLENVIRPFKDNRIRIIKYLKDYYYPTNEYLSEYIKIIIGFGDDIIMPRFKKGRMYKGMELDKEYTLEELGLFE